MGAAERRVRRARHNKGGKKDTAALSWGRSNETVGINIDVAGNSLSVVSSLLGLEVDIDVESLTLSEAVVVLLFVLVLFLGLLEIPTDERAGKDILLVLLKGDLEIESLGSLLETETDVGLLLVLLDSDDEVSGTIKDGLDSLGDERPDAGHTEGPSSRMGALAKRLSSSSMNSTTQRSPLSMTWSLPYQTWLFQPAAR